LEDFFTAQSQNGVIVGCARFARLTLLARFRGRRRVRGERAAVSERRKPNIDRPLPRERYGVIGLCRAGLLLTVDAGLRIRQIMDWGPRQASRASATSSLRCTVGDPAFRAEVKSVLKMLAPPSRKAIGRKLSNPQKEKTRRA
jgi:hypothetical protein